MTRSLKPLTPFKALAAKISAFGKLAIALARTARRSEDRGHANAARHEAEQLELFSWWMLSELTKELETLDSNMCPKGAEECRERDYAFAMLSVFFLLIKVAQDIQARCAGGSRFADGVAQLGLEQFIRQQRSPVYDIPILDPG